MLTFQFMILAQYMLSLKACHQEAEYPDQAPYLDGFYRDGGMEDFSYISSTKITMD
jgi:hypothetical protein